MDFGTPISGYVDYGFKNVADVRGKRYMDNFMTSEAMRESASNLKAAPFEGDQALRDSILEGTDTMLSDMTKRGDYENLSTAVVRAANTYGMKSKPITDNAAMYQSFIDEQKTAYQDGDIPYEQYMGNIELAKQGYTGLDVDENGEVSNYFQGVDPVKDPGFQKLMNDALSNLASSEFTNVQKVVGVVNENGKDMLQYTEAGIPVGALVVETSSGVEWVSPEQVNAVMNNLVNEPGVKAFWGRTADINTMDPTSYFSNMLAQSIDEYSQLDQATADGTLKGADKQAALKKMQQIGEQIQGMKDYADPESSLTLEERKMAAVTSEVGRIESGYRQQAQATYPYTKESSGRKESVNPYAAEAFKHLWDKVDDPDKYMQVLTLGQVEESGTPDTYFDLVEESNAYRSTAQASQDAYNLSMGQNLQIEEGINRESGTQIWSFMGSDFSSRQDAIEYKTEQVSKYANRTDNNKKELFAQAANAAEDLRISQAAIYAVWENTAPELLDDEKYKELKAAAVEADTQAAQARSTTANSLLSPMAMNANAMAISSVSTSAVNASKALKDFVAGKDLFVPGAEVQKRQVRTLKYVPGFETEEGKELNELALEQIQNSYSTLHFANPYGTEKELLAGRQMNGTVSTTDVDDRTVNYLSPGHKPESITWATSPKHGYGAFVSFEGENEDGDALPQQRLFMPLQLMDGETQLGIAPLQQYANSTASKVIDVIQQVESRPQIQTYDLHYSVKDPSGEWASKTMNIDFSGSEPRAILELDGRTVSLGVYTDNVMINATTESGEVVPQAWTFADIMNTSGMRFGGLDLNFN
jgi:hypothetical protein